MTAVATLTPPAPAGTINPGVTTADDLLGMEDDGLFELTHGRVVEKRMGHASNWTAGRIGGYLTIYVLGGSGGDVLPEQAFRCFPNDPGGVRRPDVSYILPDRVPATRTDGHIPFRPDVAVEVVSPNDNVEELEAKLADYRAAAIPLVWVMFPSVRMVRAFPRCGPFLELFDGDTLRGDPVLPGFAVAVADLFPPRATG